MWVSTGTTRKSVIAAIVITTIFGDASIVAGERRLGNRGLFQVAPRIAAIVITTIFGDASVVAGSRRLGNRGLFQVAPGQVVSDVASGLNGSS